MAYAAHGSPDVHLITAQDGRQPGRRRRHLTVRFDACAIVRAWPDGARQFVGHDGIMVKVEPTLFRMATEAVAWLDARIPASLRVDQPPRNPEQIPTPTPTGHLLGSEIPMSPRERRNVRARDLFYGFVFVCMLIRGALIDWDEFGGPGLLVTLLAVTVTAIVTGQALLHLRRRRTEAAAWKRV